MPQLHRALLRNYQPDQKAHQADDAERTNADDVKTLDHGIPSDLAGMPDQSKETDDDRTEKANQSGQCGKSYGGCLADLANHPDHRIERLRPDFGRLVSPRHGRNQPLCIVIRTDNRGFHIARCAMNEPGSDSIDIAGFGYIQRLDVVAIFSQPFRQVSDAGNRKIAGKTQRNRSVFGCLFDKIAGHRHHLYK